MKRAAVAVPLFLLSFFPLFGQLSLPGFDSAPKASITGAIHARMGDEVEGTVTATIAPGWHVNSDKPTEEFAIPTSLAIDPATAELVEAKFPPHAMKAFQFTGGKELAVFDGTFEIPFRAKLKPGANAVGVILKYQACSDTVCLPPNEARASIDATKLVQRTSAPASADAPAAGASPAFTPLTAAPKNAGSLLSADVGGTFAARGLPLTLLAIFILGLALNLTPCVYPLIPITIGYFSQQSGSSAGRRVALSSVYVLGIAVTYSALGVFSALSGKLFGAWLQQPAVLIFFALLMLVMASSMFGAFELRVPQFIANRSGGQSGLAGALMMGLVIGIVAAPCVGPFVISLIALVSSLQNAFLGFLMFFVLALGLGLPYLLLGIFSSSAWSLPRAGMWMLQVKKAMGFILIAMAFYFLRPLIGDTAFQYGVAASLLIGALFLFFFGRSQSDPVLRIAMAVLLLVAGVAFAVPQRRGPGVQWEKYSEARLAAARSAGKPVVIDFYADWCLPCKELDHKTFTDKEVIAAMEPFVRLKADLTVPSDAATKTLTEKYKVAGLPTIVFLDAQGREVSRSFGFVPPDEFLQRVQSVR